MSWLRDYLEYTKHQESPTLFHMWVGLTTMASVLGRQVWIERRSHGVTWYKVYPGQLMVVLVAPSGKGHKGTAMRFGRHLMKHAGVKVLKGKGSSEKIINIISQGNIRPGVISTGTPDAIATIVAPELSVFLSKQTYADAIVDFLTDIYDAEDPFEYMTMGGGIITLRNPCVTLLAGATPTSIGESIPEKAHSSGYLGRVLHIYHDGNERDTNPLTDLNDEDVTKEEIDKIKQMEVTLGQRLLDIKQLTGAFSYTRDGRAWMNHWAVTWAGSSGGQGEGYPTRRPDHLLRIAMLLKVSRDGAVGAIDANTLGKADKMLQEVEQNFHKAFSCIGQVDSAKHQDRILDTVSKVGGRVTTDLLITRLRRYMSIDELQHTLTVLRRSQLLIYEGTKPNGEEWWRAP